MAAANHLRPADYEQLGEDRAEAVSGRKVTGFSGARGHFNRNRAYTETGWGRFAGSAGVS